MNILIIGTGMMGPAVAFDVMSAAEVAQVTICDVSQANLDACMCKLSGHPGWQKLFALRFNVQDDEATANLFSCFDVIIAALSWDFTAGAICAALRVSCPLVGIARPAYHEMSALRDAVESARGLIIPACGLEPGLTEIVAHHLAQQFEPVEELHIRCGGIPAVPQPPLGYKVLFGGRELPIHNRPVYTIDDGILQLVRRFSGVEHVVFPSVGELEAWFDGLLPWLLDLPTLKGVRICTQKTIRWPGFAAKIQMLEEMGLLSLSSVEVDGLRVIPRSVVDAVLYPRVRLEEGEEDITIFSVEVVARQHRQAIQMIDRYDETTGFTSMARTTGFTAGLVGRMVGRGELKATGLFTPEQIITGSLFQRLTDDLSLHGIHFTAATLS